MISIRFHAEIETDLEEIWLWLGRDNPETADRFVDAVERTFQQIGQHPLIGWKRPWKDRKLRGLRSWRVDGFPSYLVFYRMEGANVAIVAILHSARFLERILKKR